MLLKYLQKSLIVFSFLLLNGCQNIANQPLTGLKPTETRSINTPLKSNQTPTYFVLTPEYTKALTMIPTNTLEIDDHISLDNIKSGQYLLISETVKYGSLYLDVVTINGSIVKKIPINNDAYWSTSTNGRYIFLTPYWEEERVKHASIFDFSTKTWEDVNTQVPCRETIMSPDKLAISFYCFDNGTYDIYLLSKNFNLAQKITDCKENHLTCFSSPAWSPDGKWFAYNRVAEPKSGVHYYPLNGYYVFNTECFKDNSCMRKQFGPIHSGTPITWSKDNELIATVDEKITFYEIKNGSAILRKEIATGVKEMQDIHNSPDGQYLVYSYDSSDTEKTINILSLSNNLSQELIKVSYTDTIIGWIIVP